MLLYGNLYKTAKKKSVCITYGGVHIQLKLVVVFFFLLKKKKRVLSFLLLYLYIYERTKVVTIVFAWLFTKLVQAIFIFC